ncbi:MAG: hypothetical protein CM15mP120_04510 [Pseudomonadota bacterium]|nr:MAG: hypothetical protein CM15mP120_04510 [Pseudomonadota bacterium]
MLAVATGRNHCLRSQLGTDAEAKTPAPLPVKAVIVTMFEIGEDEGDTAGEFQLWKERRNLNDEFPFPNPIMISFTTASRRYSAWSPVWALQSLPPRPWLWV